MIIYKITNKINGKVYIGATKQSLSDRWKQHLKKMLCYPDRKLYKAMTEFGIDNFSIEVIQEVFSYDELYNLETMYIAKYNSVDGGYNTQSTSPQREDWEEYYEHLHLSMTDEVKQRISNTMKNKIKNGEFFTPEHRKKLSEAQRGRKYSPDRAAKCATRCIACYCIVDGKRFDFKDYKDAGVWWYYNYKPFGEKYSVSIYQKKIVQSIELGYCTYGNKGHKNYKYIDNIKWYRK